MDESPLLAKDPRTPVSCAGGRCDLVGCRSTRVRKRRTMKVSVGLAAAAGDGEVRG